MALLAAQAKHAPAARPTAERDASTGDETQKNVFAVTVET
jgi:hypothetical protein